jgi:arylsulfatase A-like enzyme
MRLLSACLALTACTHSGRGARQPPDYGDVPTDTIPQFYGWVPHNILMISMDTFRRDHLDAYGDTHAAPFLSTLAENGFTADDDVQCSNWTMASTSCTLAGRYDEEAGMTPKLVANFEDQWPVGTPFLASYLHDAGYYSVISSTNGWLGPEWGNTGGYDVAFHPTDGSAWGAYLQGRDALDAARQLGAAKNWLLHVHVVEPHASYDPPEEYLAAEEALPPVPWDLSDRDVQYDVTRTDWPTMTPEEQDLLNEHLQARYSGEISWMDQQIWWIIADMDFDHLLDDTLVVFWTDHGEQFWEHGEQTHAYGLYSEENNGLLWFWSKNILPGRWSEPTSSIDLVPTLLSLEGLPIPDTVTGFPIGQAPDDRPRFAHSIARLGPESSVVLHDRKLIFYWDGRVELYDRSTDPDETTDLYDPSDVAPEARELWALLRPQIELQQQVSPEYSVAWPTELD